MTLFKNIKEMLKTLNGAQDLLSEMFEKRNAFSYEYEMGVSFFNDATKIDKLIEQEIIIKNGIYIEIDEKYLKFFEVILEVNEQISTAFITDTISKIKESIIYYFSENKEEKKYTYVRKIKSSLQEIARIINRSIIDLNRNIENTFKTETNYQIKFSKLQDFDEKRNQIKTLIEKTNDLIKEEEKTFFSIATDNELSEIVNKLALQLGEARTSILETHNQIIKYINQIKYNTQLIEKLKQVKYLKDQFELKSKTNFVAVLEQDNALFLQRKPTFSTRISLSYLQTDEGRDLTEKIAKKFKNKTKIQKKIAQNISNEYLQTEVKKEYFLDLEEVKRGFMASGNNLFDFVRLYDFKEKLDFGEKMTVFCRLVSSYEKEFIITDTFKTIDEVEFALVYPK